VARRATVAGWFVVCILDRQGMEDYAVAQLLASPLGGFVLRCESIALRRRHPERQEQEVAPPAIGRSLAGKELADRQAGMAGVARRATRRFKASGACRPIGTIPLMKDYGVEQLRNVPRFTMSNAKRKLLAQALWYSRVRPL
jgi:hypothetical protein